MANPHKGEIEFRAGDRVLTLKMGHNARAEAEGLLGKPFPEILADMQDKAKVSNELVRTLLWAGLHQHHPDLSLFDAGDLMDEVGDEYVGERFGEALILAAPKPSAVPPRKTKQGKAGTTS